MNCCKNASPTTINWRAGILAIAATALLPFAALGADEESSKPKEEMIITGTAGGSEIRKLDASYSITTVNEDDITKFSPKSTADLLKLVPGVWSESSGGVSGANVFFRGFPGGGDAPFLTVQLQGAPIYPPSTLSFLENTTMFRIDETVKRVEALRGGPNSVLSNGQPGLTTNFILKEGGPETEGLIKYTGSDYDLQRFDGVVSGEIHEGLYYMAGGYISSSPGIRNAGFNAEEGHQFTVNITKELEHGEFNIYTRDTDDHGTWYLPAALNVPKIDGDYTQVGTLNRQRQIIFGPDNQTKTLDLGQGRGWDGNVTGASFRFDFLDDLELVDRVNFTSGDADTVGLVPGGGAVNVGDLESDPATDPNAVVTGPLTGSVTGRPILTSEFIQQFGAWEVRKDVESFTNDISVAKTWDDAKVTVGYYTSTFSSDDVWSLGNSKYQVVENGGEVVNGIACNAPGIDGCPGNFNFDLDSKGDARTNAIYVSGKYTYGDFTFDAGVRYENYEVDYSADEGQTGQATFVVKGYDQTEYSGTVAVDYAITDVMGVFARYSTGSKFPSFDDFRDNQALFNEGNDLIQDVDSVELGYKWATDNWSLYTTGFYTTVQPSFDVIISGVVTKPAQDTNAYGVEIDGTYANDLGISFTVNGTLQKAEIDGGPNDGNDQKRQPNFQIRLTPAYQFDLGPAMFTLYGTFTAVDDRFSDSENTVKIKSYEKYDLGLIAAIDQLEFQVSGDNITNDNGLTEGDPRNPTAPNGRFILPRSFKFSVAYSF